MYYISRGQNVENRDQKLYILKDKNGNVVDQRWARNGDEAFKQFLRNHNELDESDLEFEVGV